MGSVTAYIYDPDSNVVGGFQEGDEINDTSNVHVSLQRPIMTFPIPGNAWGRRGHEGGVVGGIITVL